MVQEELLWFPLERLAKEKALQCRAPSQERRPSAGTAAVRCDVAAPAITGAKLLRNGLAHVTFTGRQL